MNTPTTATTTLTVDASAIVAVIPTNKRKIVLGEFGKGRFSPAMLELYNDAQRIFGFEKVQAHAVADQIGNDVGQLSRAQVELAYGKSVGKDGHRTLKEVTKAIKVKNTWAMTVGALCSQLDDLRKQGLVIVDVEVHPDIMDAINDRAASFEPVSELPKA